MTRIPIAYFIIIVSLITSACGPGQLFGPTITYTPTSTLTLLPTPTSTLTPTPTSTLTPTATLPPIQITAISAGGGFACALTTNGGVMCWGFNYWSQLGTGSGATYLTTPNDVYNLTSGASAIAAGGAHACALTTSGGVVCWGDNDSGQLGNGNRYRSSIPVKVSGFVDGAVAITSGGFHTCALTTSGGVKCWGENTHGQLGDGTRNNSSTPVDVVGLTNGATAIAAGFYHTCVLTKNGGVMCWGGGGDGEVGNGRMSLSNTPVNVSGLTGGVIAVSTGQYHTCALTTAGGVKCWGDNSIGALGDGTTTNRAKPVDVSGLESGVSAIDAGNGHTCALTTGGGVICWGSNGYGQLGDGSTNNSGTPVSVVGLNNGVNAISAGEAFTCALTSDGWIKCWGLNGLGELGDGTYNDHWTPADVKR